MKDGKRVTIDIVAPLKGKKAETKTNNSFPQNEYV